MVLKLIHSILVNSVFTNSFPIYAVPCQQNLAFLFEYSDGNEYLTKKGRFVLLGS